MLITQKDESEKQELAGFGMVTNERCEVCGAQLVLNLEHDSYYCPTCNKWTDLKE